MELLDRDSTLILTGTKRLLTASTVTMKMAPSLVRLYEQKPKSLLSLYILFLTVGMFSTDSYVRGVDKLQAPLFRIG